MSVNDDNQQYESFDFSDDTLIQDETDLNNRKRRREAVKKACDACRGRHVKCDGNSPCSRCSTAKIPCTYEHVTVRKPPAPKDKSKQMENKLNDLQKRIEELTARNAQLEQDLRKPSPQMDGSVAATINTTTSTTSSTIHFGSNPLIRNDQPQQPQQPQQQQHQPQQQLQHYNEWNSNYGYYGNQAIVPTNSQSLVMSPLPMGSPDTVFSTTLFDLNYSYEENFMPVTGVKPPQINLGEYWNQELPDRVYLLQTIIMASGYFALGNRENSMELLVQARNSISRVFDVVDPVIAAAHSLFSLLYSAMGRPEEAMLHNSMAFSKSNAIIRYGNNKANNDVYATLIGCLMHRFLTSRSEMKMLIPKILQFLQHTSDEFRSFTTLSILTGKVMISLIEEPWNAQNFPELISLLDKAFALLPKSRLKDPLSFSNTIRGIEAAVYYSCGYRETALKMLERVVASMPTRAEDMKPFHASTFSIAAQIYMCEGNLEPVNHIIYCLNLAMGRHPIMQRVLQYILEPECRDALAETEPIWRCLGICRIPPGKTLAEVFPSQPQITGSNPFRDG